MPIVSLNTVLAADPEEPGTWTIVPTAKTNKLIMSIAHQLSERLEQPELHSNSQYD